MKKLFLIFAVLMTTNVFAAKHCAPCDGKGRVDQGTCNNSNPSSGKVCTNAMECTEAEYQCTCASGYELYNSLCTTVCGVNEERNDRGACVCQAGFKKTNGICVEDCVHGEFLNPGERCCDTTACKQHGGNTPGFQLFCIESNKPLGNGEFYPTNGQCIACFNGTLNGDVCECPDGTNYDPSTGLCVEVVLHCGPHEHEENGVCVSDCDGCNTLGGTADFTYQVSAGGVNSDLYVCEVGFKASECEDGSCGLNYIDFDGRIIRYGEESNPWINLDTRIKHGEINVYLNSIKAVSSFYVKYCLDIDRIIVGTPPGNKTIYGTLEGMVAYTSGTDNNYYSTVGLLAEVFHGCTETLDLIDSHEVKSGEGDSVPTYLCLPLDKTAKTKCAWEVVYTETNGCLRKLFKDIDAVTGAVTNKTSSGMVTTELEYNLTFTGHQCL